MTELAALQDLIDRDAVTGALTHSAFMRRACAEMSNAQHSGQSLALVVFDLDHAAGDHVLSTFGSLLARRLGTADNIGRLGGEAFALLLRDSNIDAAQQMIDRLRDDFSDVATFSAGVTMLMSGE